MAFQINFLLLFCSSFVFLVSGQEICTTTPCKTLSDTLQHRSMNTAVKPCDDFYEYICGNYPKFHPINPTYEWSGTFLDRQLLVLEEINEAYKNALNSSSKAVKYVAELYNECRDTDAWERRGTAPLVEFVEATVGGWPMLGKRNGTQSMPKKKWQDIFVDVFSKAGLSYIFDIRDMIGTLRFQAGMVVMNPKNLYQPRFISNETDIAHYQEFLLNLTAVLGVNNASIDRAHLLQEIEHLIHFEQNLEKVFNNPSPMHDDFGGTLEQFEKGATHGKVQWTKMMKQIQANFVKQSSNFHQSTYNESTKTEGIKMHYINGVVALLETTPVEVVQNFFATAISVNFGILTTAKVREAIYHFTGNKELLNVRASCGTVAQNWPLVMGRVYVDSHFSRAEKVAATTLVAEIKASFRENLEKRNQWLDSTTRKYAIEKLDAITAEIGYPEWLLDDEKIDNHYPDLKTADLQKGKLFEKIIKIVARSRGTEIEVTPHEAKNETHFTINPAAVNAFYNVLENSILIPAGILQPPMFDHELPWSANYGAIGAILGHELTHGFDSRGKNYDLHGKLKNWWSANTTKAFEEKAHCMAKQYSDIVDPRLNEHLHGGQNLGENIADNGGIKEAFGAYQVHKTKVNDTKVLPGLKFSPDQTFFVAYANIWCQAITTKKLKFNMFVDPHAPNKYRVNVVLGNFDQFSKAFNCPVGSKMNPVNKCSIW